VWWACAGAVAPRFGLPGAAAAPTAGDSTFAALHGLYWLTANLGAESPLLLAVDDLHWCDHSSLLYLGYLARRLEGLPIAVVASLRPSEPGPDAALLAELTGDPLARRIAPRPLSRDAVASVVRDRLGDAVAPAFADACQTSTRGNPLYLAELLKTLELEHVRPDESSVGVVADIGPRAVSHALRLRLARLSPEAGRVARALAVLGDGADTAAVAALSGVEGEALAAASRELVRAEIVRPEPPLGFVHPLVEAAIHGDLAPGERELEHGRAARILLELGAPAERVAAHVQATPRSGEAWVVEVLRSAARAAFAKGAPDAALASLRRALLEPLDAETRTQLLFEEGRSQSLMSLPEAVPALRGAYAGARDPKVRGEVADWLACTLTFLDATDEAAGIVERTRRELPPELDDLGRQLEAGELLALMFGAPKDVDGLRSRVRGYRTVDPARGLGAKVLASVAAWEWAESAGPSRDVVALARSALADGQLLIADTPERAAGAILTLALADLDEATAAWEVLRSEAYRTGFVYTLLAVQLWGGYTQQLRGELPDAEAELRAALATAADWGVPTQASWATAILAEVLVERGAVAEARTVLDRAVRPPAGSDPAMLLAGAELRVRLAEGRPEEALAHADVVRLHAGWRRHPRYAPWRSLQAQALDRLGRTREAAAVAEAELEIANEWGSPGTVGRSLRVLGTIERDAGIRRLEEACAVLERAPARLERAKAFAALGESLRRARRPTEAREPLRRALELAEICGAAPLVERTRSELYATGSRPRASALHGVAALTSSERRVAELAAGGHANRDIAQQLYVTQKTVEVHLSNTYRKLDIGSRRELQHALTAG
jgi:DNA-binding CsgD family transcriptional regulator